MNILPTMTMLRLALTNLKVNKLRSALTVSGIVFGTAAVIATLASNEGAAAYIRTEIKKLGTNVIYASRTDANAPTLTIADRRRLVEYLPEIKSAALVYALGGTTVRAGANTSSPAMLAVEGGYFAVNSIDFDAGRAFTAGEVRDRDMVMVVGSKIATALFGKAPAIGNYVHLIVAERPLTFRVIGVLREKGGTAGAQVDDAIYVPLRLGAKLVQPGAMRAVLVAKLKNDEDSARVKVAMKGILTMGQDGDVDVSDARDAIEGTRRIWQKQNLVGIILASISLVTGGVGIMNIMLLSIAQRRREIGIRKSVGARTRQVFTQFLAESTLLCLLGGVLGIGIGVLFGHKVAALMGQWEAQISPSVVLLALGSACLTGIVFGLAPAMRASKLDPFEALRG